MADYIQIEFQEISTPQAEILIAALNEIGFDGFEEHERKLTAFITKENFRAALLNEVAAQYHLSYTSVDIKETNWNAVWESNFEPVVVDEFVGVRAHFHEPIKNVQHEIIITPKMSFGTGHHATTYMMMQQMSNIDFNNKNVFDFGTGTGVLAILAEKLKAASITATDIDEWSIENATENIERNFCSRITLLQSSSPAMHQSFDIILANINKNVILENIHTLSSQLSAEGIILFSGLLKDDEMDIIKAAREQYLFLIEKTEKDDWLCLKMRC